MTLQDSWPLIARGVLFTLFLAAFFRLLDVRGPLAGHGHPTERILLVFLVLGTLFICLQSRVPVWGVAVGCLVSLAIVATVKLVARG